MFTYRLEELTETLDEDRLKKEKKLVSYIFIYTTANKLWQH